MTTGDTEAVADWLIDGARSAAESHTVLEEMCERLVECGIPLWRVSVFVRTLHPQIMGRRFTWRAGVGIEVRESPHEMLQSADFRESPVRRVYDTNEPIRRRLADAGCPLDFPILHVLHADGVTDYLALPLRFTNGEIHVATWTTREPGGFTGAQIAGIEAIAVPQIATFQAAVQFARSEGIIPAPESAHAIRVAIDEALRSKKEGKRKTIVFNLSGHGHFDLGAYEAHLAGKLQDYEYPAEKIAEALRGVPQIKG